MKSTVESDAQFDARIAAEDIEASAIPCPLDTCRAPAGEPCRTEEGAERLRHCARLRAVRKRAGA
jgi:hypothetical protein